MNFKKLSVIIPVYNEKKTIKEVVDRVKNVKINKEIIIVDDFSTDGTKDILKKMEGDKDVKIIYHSKNKGKGAAIRTGINYVTGDIVIIQDADLEYDPKEYPKLIKPILNRETDVVYGSRLLGHHIDMYWLHKIGNDFLTYLTNFLYGSCITDMETGYKVFKKEVIKGIKLRARGFDFEPEITSKILKRGHKIKEVPIKFDNPRTLEEGKKINCIDGIKAIYHLFRYRFFD